MANPEMHGNLTTIDFEDGELVVALEGILVTNNDLVSQVTFSTRKQDGKVWTV